MMCLVSLDDVGLKSHTIPLYVDKEMLMRKVLGALSIALLVGCGGGGGSSCSGDNPLVCERAGTCCARGYPFSCGDGYCYQYGCPIGSPATEICVLKSAEKLQSLDLREEVPTLDIGQENARDSEGYPHTN